MPERYCLVGPVVHRYLRLLMPPLHLKRFLIVGEQVAGIRDVIAKARPDLQLRMKRLVDIGPEDLDWGEGFIGFRRPATPTWGKIQWIHCIGAGVDGLIFGHPLGPEILLTKTSEDFGPAIGEWCLTRALVVNQQIFELALDQQAGHWNRTREPVVLRGQRAVVLGTGSVGRGIARVFRAVGVSVTGLSRTGGRHLDFDHVAGAERFAEFVPAADWFILAAPLTAATRHWLTRDRLAQCGGVYLMNAGRGAVVDESALPEALEKGWIRGAALDVFETEPLPADSPLWRHPQVAISPHLSGPSTVEATAHGFLECLATVERGAHSHLTVDPDRGY